MGKNDVIIRSTDSDLLAISLLNHDKLDLKNRNIVIHYGNNSVGAMYCYLNKLVESIQNDSKYSLLETRQIPTAKILGALHFITGCDDLSFLRGFTKDFCLKTFIKHCSLICGESPKKCEDFINGETDATKEFFTRFLVCLYCQKFSSSFSPGELTTLCADPNDENSFNTIRKNTWHRTIVTNNQLPTTTAIAFHCTRIACVLKLNSSATNVEISNSDFTKCGWRMIL